MFILFGFAFMVCATDIPYFGFYFSHISAVVLTWADDAGFILKMILGDVRLWWVIIAFIIVITVYFLISLRIFRKTLIQRDFPDSKNKIRYVFRNIGISFLAFIILFIGIRGRIETKSPLRIGTAFFCNYSFANQLGLSPVYYFFHSVLFSMKSESRSIQLMDNQKAIENTRQYLNIKSDPKFQSPIARQISPDKPQHKANVVLIIMESMSSAFLSRYGNQENLTPNLDRFAREGYSFDNIYTSGIHTFNGIYSLFTSFPCIRKQNPLKNMSMKKYSGITSVLRNHGYSTVFFTTHDDQFDNMGGFLKYNDFQRVVSLKDYPGQKSNGTWGVPDDFMFNFSIPIIDDLAGKGNPFFVSFATTSNHLPYLIPEYFKSEKKEIEKKAVQYADWSIGKFIQAVSTKNWFKNTLFVFIADHGMMIDPQYDIPLNYHRSPLIIYSPSLLSESRVINGFGGQMDVFPTIMGLLNLPYINNTLGIDLLKEKRPYIYFSSDDVYGVIDQQFFLIVHDGGSSRLYQYKDGNTTDYLPQNKLKAKEMRNYAESMFQVTQWIIDNRKYGEENPGL